MSRNRSPSIHLFEKGSYSECLHACQRFYAQNPSDLNNLLLLTACHFQLNEMQQSAFYGKQAIGVDHTFVEAHVAVGNALRELGDEEAAKELYNKALRIQPRFAHAYAGLGIIHFQQGNRNESLSCLEMATSLDAVFKVNLGLVLVAAGDNAGGKVNLSQQSEKSAIAQLALGNIAHQGGEFDEAIGHYSEALRLEPTFVDAASNLCGSQIELFKTTLDNQHTLQETTFRLEKMISSFKRCQSAHSKLGLCHRLCGKHGLAQRYLWGAVTLDHSNADELCNLAALHVETGKYEQAAKLCLRALQPSPDHAQAFGTLGLALYQMGYNKNALECLYTAEQLNPKSSILSSNLGSVLCEVGDAVQSARLQKRAIALDPFNTAAFVSLGNAYFDCNQLEYARKCYQTSIDSNTIEHGVTALNNMALLHLSQGKFEEAADCVLQLRQQLDSKSKVSLSTVALVDAFVCQWAYRNKSFEQTVGEDFRRLQPIHAHLIPGISPEMTLSIANAFSRRLRQRALHDNNNEPFEHSLPAPDGMIRIGYVSSNFGNNIIVQGVIGQHNREKFHVVCFALSPPDDGSQCKIVQVKAGIVDLSKLSILEAASKINEHNCHVLIDLDGHVQGALPELFTLRPTPLQISMNWGGTTGSASGIDYILGDKFTISEDHRPFFSEKIIYMPHLVPIPDIVEGLDPDTSLLRKKYNISADSFVYACFSKPYQIDPELFQAWMDILHKAPNSMLVLIQHSTIMEENLRKEASKYPQVANDQVVFLDLVPTHEAHLARCCIVDVFLDTQCSDVATSCDALHSAAPLITIAGNHSSGSLLTSLGVSEFIVDSLGDYKQLAIALSEDEDKFIDISHLLEDARESSELFDCKSWVGSFEYAVEAALERHRQGLKPDHIFL